MEAKSSKDNFEERMLLAVAEAQKARLLSPPNPWVGAVLETKSGIVVGHTQSPGSFHAEIAALERAGTAAKGSTLYVTLEPCSHHGKTPPCVNAIVQAGVKRVVIALVDPDRRVRGGGIDYLRTHGVEVIEGVAKDQVKNQLAPYLKQRATGFPWVVLKLAVTLDGRTAANDGSSNWITGEIARTRVQELRAESDVIAVGANTVRIDNPQLRVRTSGFVRAPRRIIFGRIPSGANVLPAEEFLGSPQEFLDSLAHGETIQVLLEGGAALAKSFFDADLIDQYVFHIAPAIHGGEDGRSAFSGSGAATIADLTRLEFKNVGSLGNDIEIVAWSQRASRLIQSL